MNVMWMPASSWLFFFSQVIFVHLLFKISPQKIGLSWIVRRYAETSTIIPSIRIPTRTLFSSKFQSDIFQRLSNLRRDDKYCTFIRLTTFKEQKSLSNTETQMFQMQTLLNLTKAMKRVLLEKLIFSQTVDKFPSSYAKKKFVLWVMDINLPIDNHNIQNFRRFYISLKISN